MRALVWCVAAIAAGVALLGSGTAVELAAQSVRTPPPTLRAYLHIFLAYAAAWVLLLLWVLRIASKLKEAGRNGSP